MKWTLSLATLWIVAGCTLHGQAPSPAVSALKVEDPAASVKELDPAKARSMFSFYRDSRVRKEASFYVEFDREELITLLQNSDQPTVKILAGAYLDDDEEPGRRLRSTILIQTATGGASAGLSRFPFLTYRYFEGTALCPPPSPCRLEN